MLTFLQSLRQNPAELAKLEETLFLLWGDLKERKEGRAAATSVKLARRQGYARRRETRVVPAVVKRENGEQATLGGGGPYIL